MNPGRALFIFLLVLAAACGAGWAGYHYGQQHAIASDPVATATEAATEPAQESIASVRVVNLREAEISETIKAYGVITAEPGEVGVLTVPFESRVRKVRVTGGQPVEKDTALVELEPSPDAREEYQETVSALAAAKKDLKQTQERYDIKLGTQQELLQAQQAADAAQLKMTSLEQRGVTDKQRIIAAEGPGLVSKLDVQEGQIVPAGGPLVEIVARGRVQIRFGVEPSEVSRLKVDQPVRIFSVNGGAADGAGGKVRLITERINPDTRLVDVFVSPDQPQGLLLEGFVRGELLSPPKKALLAPRDAVLPDGDGFSLYTVADGHAVKHTVRVGISSDKDIEVIADDLKPGDHIVARGNYELENGMAVSEETAP